MRYIQSEERLPIPENGEHSIVPEYSSVSVLGGVNHEPRASTIERPGTVMRQRQQDIQRWNYLLNGGFRSGK
jgi:hypothetical protein